MKQIILSIIIISISISVKAQDKKTTFLTNNITVRAGYQNYWTKQNENNFYDFKYGNPETMHIYSSKGLSFDILIPTKKESLNFVIGTIVAPGSQDTSPSFWAKPSHETNYQQELYEFRSNGGGVYGGINAQVGHKNFGIDMTFGIGMFSFKQVYVYYNSYYTPAVEVYDTQSTQGLGATASIGLYLKVWRFTLSPSWQYVYSGGNDYSVLLYEYYLPISFRF